MKDRDPKTLLYSEPTTIVGPPITVGLEPEFLKRIEALEATIAEHEEYFKTIEAVLSKIQAVYEALQDGRL